MPPTARPLLCLSTFPRCTWRLDWNNVRWSGLCRAQSSQCPFPTSRPPGHMGLVKALARNLPETPAWRDRGLLQLQLDQAPAGSTPSLHLSFCPVLAFFTPATCPFSSFPWLSKLLSSLLTEPMCVDTHSGGQQHRALQLCKSFFCPVFIAPP